MPDNRLDFLSALRRHQSNDTSTLGLKSPDSLRLRLSYRNGTVYITPVDQTGKPVSPSDYDNGGKHGPLLRMLDRISLGQSLDFDWTDNSDESYEYSTTEFPFLAGFIPAWADSLVDADGAPLLFDPVPLRVTMTISPSDDMAESDQLDCSFTVDIPEGNDEKNAPQTEKVIAFISSDYAITPGKVRCIEPVGDRFSDLHAFMSPFQAGMLDSYLSIFFSTIDQGINVDYGGRRVRRSNEHVHPTPVLVIEKVDSDDSLCLRVSESAGNLPHDICTQFSITNIASVSDDTIYIRPLGESTLPHSDELVQQAIEKCTSKREARQIWHEDHLFVVPKEIAAEFLFKSFASLLDNFRILGAEKLKRYKIVAAKPHLNLKIGSGIDYLEGKASVDIDGQRFTISDILSQYGHQRYVTLNDGNRAVIDEGYMKRLQRIFHNVSKRGNNVKISFFDLPEVMELLDDKERQEKGFGRYRSFYEGFNALADTTCDTPLLKAQLRDYQRSGLKWINYLYDNRMGGCLADDMGLGKTVQAIAMLTRSVPKAEHPTLIIMPRSLLFNWQEELKRFAPGLSVATHYGPARNLDESLKAQVVLTTYGMVRSDIELLVKQEFDYVILDESQNIKNVDTLVTKAVWLLNANHRLALSGTPIENNLTELYSLFHFLNPAMFGSLQDFNTQYAGPIQRLGDEETATALRRKVFPFMLRRLKRDVLSDLPDRTDQTLMVDMSERQKALYEQRRAYFAGEIESTIAHEGIHKASFLLLQALSELRQIASIPEEKSDGAIASPKIDLLMDQLTSAVRNGHKVVAFFNFLGGIELTAERLDREGIGYGIMTGVTRDRKKAVDRFQTDPACQVMLMTVKTGGVGLNLVAADTVFIVEPWWNKAAEEQAINRLHRIGQKKAVNCYYLITADTIEEKIRQLQEQKSALVDAVISSDTSSGKNLTPDEISYLLS